MFVRVREKSQRGREMRREMGEIVVCSCSCIYHLFFYCLWLFFFFFNCVVTCEVKLSLCLEKRCLRALGCGVVS